jgi:hypothetical protein
MYDSRKTDLKACTKYRTNRFIRNGGEWFFSTREGTMEGPFGFKHEAEDRLEIYKRVMASGFMPGDSKLALDPLEIEEK